VILDRSRGPSSRTPDRTNSFWISAESARARFRRRKSADASITAFIPLSVRVNGAGRSTGCCCGAGLRRGAFGRRGEGIETEASRRSRSRHTSSYSWNKGCSCSSFRSSSRRSRSALIRSVIRYSCSNELKRELLVARKAACKDRQPSAGAGHLRHFPLQRRDRLLGIFPVTLTGDRRFESGSLQRRVCCKPILPLCFKGHAVGIVDLRQCLRGQTTMIHVRDHEEAKVSATPPPAAFSTAE